MQKPLLFDAHFHLDLLNHPEVKLQQALKKGVVGGLSAGVWPTDWERILFQEKDLEKSIQFARKDSIHLWDEKKFLCFLSIGLHPEFLARHLLDNNGKIHKEKMQEVFHFFQKKLEQNRQYIWAIGETGFDLSKDALEINGAKVTKDELLDLQSMAFDFCLQMSLKYQLPLIVHSRSGWGVTLKKLKEAKVKGCCGMMIHCYSGPSDDMKTLQELGIYCSFGGVATWNTAKKVRKAFELCAPHLRLVETDSPDLSPEFPNGERGKENEPANLFWISKYLSEKIGETHADFCQMMNENFLRFLGVEEKIERKY